MARASDAHVARWSGGKRSLIQALLSAVSCAVQKRNGIIAHVALQKILSNLPRAPQVLSKEFVYMYSSKNYKNGSKQAGLRQSHGDTASSQEQSMLGGDGDDVGVALR